MKKVDKHFLHIIGIYCQYPYHTAILILENQEVRITINILHQSINNIVNISYIDNLVNRVRSVLDISSTQSEM